jgi:hypothetical protein
MTWSPTFFRCKSRGAGCNRHLTTAPLPACNDCSIFGSKEVEAASHES